MTIVGGKSQLLGNVIYGQLVTANSRQLAGEDAGIIGDGGFDLGARVHQLSGNVRQLGARTDVPAAFQASLDDRAPFGLIDFFTAARGKHQ